MLSYLLLVLLYLAPAMPSTRLDCQSIQLQQDTIYILDVFLCEQLLHPFVTTLPDNAQLYNASVNGIGTRISTTPYQVDRYIVIKPDSGYTGPVSFTIESKLLVHIDYSAVESAPIAQSTSMYAVETLPRTVNLSQFSYDSNSEISQLWYYITKMPALGSIAGIRRTITYLNDSQTSFIYTSNQHTANTVDTVQFGIDNRDLDSYQPGIITFNILPVLIQCYDLDVQVYEETTVVISLETSVPHDVDFTLVVIIEEFPKYGELYEFTVDSVAGTYLGSHITDRFSSKLPLSVVYLPFMHYYGNDMFTYRVVYEDASKLESDTVGNVSIVVKPVKDPPRVPDEPYTEIVQAKSYVSIYLLGYDVDTTFLSAEILVLPKLGELRDVSGNLIELKKVFFPRNVTYSTNSSGGDTDSFVYRLYDKELFSDNQTVFVEIQQDPQALTTNMEILEDQLTWIAFSFNHVFKPYQVQILSVPSNASLYTIGDRPQSKDSKLSPEDILHHNCHVIAIIPDTDFNSPPMQTINFRVIDARGLFSDGAVVITVKGVNDPPIAPDRHIVMNASTSIQLILNGNDIDASGILSATITSLPLKGELSTSSGDIIEEPGFVVEDLIVVFTPNRYEFGLNYTSFTYTTKDNYGMVSLKNGTVTITVEYITTEPIAKNKSVTIDRNSSTIIVLELVDFDKILEDWTGYITSLPQNGILYQVNELGNPTDSIKLPMQSVFDGKDSTRLHRVYYEPDYLFYGMDEFRFQGKEDSDFVGIVSIVVSFVDYAPKASNLHVQIPEDTNITIELPVIQLDSLGLSFLILSLPQRGHLYDLESEILTVPHKLMSNIVKFRPIENEYGHNYALFTFNANTSTQVSNEAVVYVSVLSDNDIPLVLNQSLHVSEESALLMVLNVNDPDHTPWTAYIATSPQYGKLYQVNQDGSQSMNILNTGAVLDGSKESGLHRVIYIPNDHFSSPPYDNFTFYAIDVLGIQSLVNASVMIFVDEVQDPPIVCNATFFAYEDEVLFMNISTIITDVDSEITEISIRVLELPARGELGVNCSEDSKESIDISKWYSANCFLSFIGIHNEYGEPYTEFVMLARDSFNTTSDNATLTINVISKSDAPIALDSQVSGLEDNGIKIQLQAFDQEDDKLMAQIESFPQYGSLTRLDGTSIIPTSPRTASDLLLIYKPNENFFSPPLDEFSFSVLDSTSQSENIGTVTINISAVNDAPTASDMTVTLDEDHRYDFALGAHDVEEDPLIVIITSIPAKGTLYQYGSNNNISIPNTQVLDKKFRVTFLPEINEFGFQYTTFTYAVSDGNLLSDNGTVTINVNSVNDPPIVKDSTLIVQEDTASRLLLNASDPEGDILIITILTVTLYGQLFEFSGTDANIIDRGDMLHPGSLFVNYNPEPDFVSPPIDRFTFKASDGNLESGVATVSIEVQKVNDPPVVNSFTVRMDEDSNLDIQLNVLDVDSQNVIAIIRSLPLKGSLFQSDKTLIDTPFTTVTNPKYFVIYTPEPDSSSLGTDVFDFFIYYAFDGEVNSTEDARVDIFVNPTEDPPTIESERLETLEENDLTIALNVSDKDIDEILTVSIVEIPNPIHASLYQFIDGNDDRGSLLGVADSLSDNDHRLIFGPEVDISSIEVSFKVRVCDSHAECDEATIDVYIINVNDPPTIENVNTPIISKNSVKISYESYIHDSDNPDSLNIQIMEAPQRGNFLIDNIKVLDYPTDFFNGSLSFQPPGDTTTEIAASFPYVSVKYRAFDGLNYSIEASLVILVSCDTDTGEYVNVWSPGKICNLCPHGAICSQTGDHIPGNKQGYWRSQLPGNEYLFVSCSPNEACSESVKLGDSIYNITNNTCLEGYTGFLCGSCTSEYFRLQSFCLACNIDWDLYTWIIVIILLVLFVSMIAVFIVNRIDIGIITISIGFFQTLLIISQFKHESSSHVFDHGVLLIFKDITSLTCPLSSLDYASRWVFQILIPVVVVGLLMLLSGIHYLYTLWKRRQIDMNDLQMQAYWQTSHILLRRKLIKFTVGLLSVFYLSLVPNALELFDCSELEDGTKVLDIEPSIVCFNSDLWRSLSVPAILALLLYGFGVPVFLVIVLFLRRPPSTFSEDCIYCPCFRKALNPNDQRRRRAKLRRQLVLLRHIDPQSRKRLSFDEAYAKEFEEWNQKYGYLTEIYDPICFYWELIVIVRKLLLSMAQLFLSTYPMSQATLSTFVILIAIFLNIWARPFRSPSNNLLELTTLSCSCLVLVSTMIVYGDADFRNHAVGKALDYLINVIIYLSIAYIFFLVLKGFIRQSKWRFYWLLRICPCLEQKQNYEDDEDDLYFPLAGDMSSFSDYHDHDHDHEKVNALDFDINEAIERDSLNSLNSFD